MIIPFIYHVMLLLRLRLTDILVGTCSELMYELKRLQHSERPVTGSESRDKVDSFFSKRLQRSDNPSHVANTDDVEEHRPEHVSLAMPLLYSWYHD